MKKYGITWDFSKGHIPPSPNPHQRIQGSTFKISFWLELNLDRKSTFSNCSYDFYLPVNMSGWNSLHCFPVSLFMAAGRGRKEFFNDFQNPKERSQRRTCSKFWWVSSDETFELIWAGFCLIWGTKTVDSLLASSGKIILVWKTLILTKLSYPWYLFRSYWIDIAVLQPKGLPTILNTSGNF